jgi:hypothetical protein
VKGTILSATATPPSRATTPLIRPHATAYTKENTKDTYSTDAGGVLMWHAQLPPNYPLLLLLLSSSSAQQATNSMLAYILLSDFFRNELSHASAMARALQ